MRRPGWRRKSSDPFLTDPRECHFDPKVLQCTGSNVPPACLTHEQVTTMTNYYAEVIRPITGLLIYPGYERGNETDDTSVLGLAFQELLPEPVYDGLFYWVFGPSFGYLSSAINYTNFDFNKDVDKVDDALAEPLNAVSTDLADFKRRGNKLIMYQGWADTVIPSQSSINYFNALVHHDSEDNDGFHQVRFEPDRDNNLVKTQKISSSVHGSGDVPLLGWAWAKRVRCPYASCKLGRARRDARNDHRHEVRERHTSGSADDPPSVRVPEGCNTTGSGDTNVATNFTCVTGEPAFNQTPAPQYGP